MKKLHITVMMAVLLTACGHRASDGTADDSDSVAVAEGASFEGMQYAAWLHIIKQEETDRYVTHLHQERTGLCLPAV